MVDGGEGRIPPELRDEGLEEAPQVTEESLVEDAARIFADGDTSKSTMEHFYAQAQALNPNMERGIFLGAIESRAAEMRVQAAATPEAPAASPTLELPANSVEEKSAVATGSPEFIARPGQKYTNFSDLRREGQLGDPVEASADSTPVVPMPERAVPTGRQRAKKRVVAPATTNLNEGWQVPQPPEKRTRQLNESLPKKVSADDRNAAEFRYVDLRTQLQETQERLLASPQFAKIKDKKIREERVRASEEMQPLLQEFNRVKNILAAEVKPAAAARSKVAVRPESAMGAPESAQPELPATPMSALDVRPANTPDDRGPDHSLDNVFTADEDLFRSSPNAPQSAAPVRPESTPIPIATEPERPITSIPSTESIEEIQLAALASERAARERAQAVPSQEGASTEPLVESVVSSAAEIASTPEVAPEVREVREKTPEQGAIEDARAAYTKALLKERSWFSQGNKKELDRSSRQYREALSAGLRVDLEKLKQEYPQGEQGLSETEQAAYIGQVLEASLKYRFEEENAFRESLADPNRKHTMEKMKVWWRNHWKQRLAGGIVASVASGGFLPLLMSQASMALNFESALRGMGKTIGKKWGASKELTHEEIGQISDRAEIERRLAAHTFDVVEFGEVQAAKAGAKKKKGAVETAEPKAMTKTRDLLQDRLGELVRAEREQEIEERLKAGEPVDDVIQEVIRSSLESGSTLHDAYLNRIHRNKNFSKVRVVGSVAGGILVGAAAHEAVQHAVRSEAVQHGTKAVREFFSNLFQHSEHTMEAARHGGALGSAYRDSAADTSNWAGLGRPVDALNLHPEIAAAEAAKQVAQATTETAQRGDSIWNLAERYVDRLHPEFNAEQKTWMVDSIKDAVTKAPETFGLHDVNHIDIGQQVDFSKAGIDVEQLAGKAAKLSAETLASIKENNALLEAWQQAHPGEMLTNEQIDSILHGSVSASETVATPALGVVTTDHVPMAEFYATDAYGHSHFQLPDTPTNVEAVIPHVPETVVQTAVEGVRMTPDLSMEYSHYQALSVGMPDHALEQLGKSIKTISLEQAQLERGPVDEAVGGLAVEQSVKDSTAASLRKLARGLLQAGHKSNESLAAGLEWMRVNR